MYELKWYKDLSDRLMKALRLDTMPTAVFLSMERPENTKQLDRDDLKACAMLDVARLEGKVFYTTIENHECPHARHVLGMARREDCYPADGPGINWAWGDYPDKGRSMTATPIAWARQVSDPNVLKIAPHTVKYVSYSPLDKCFWDPAIGGGVVVVTCTPNAGMSLYRAATYKLGTPIPDATTQVGSTCNGIIIQPYLRGKMCYTLGCVGGRTFPKIKTEDLFFGFPVETLEDLVDSLETSLRRRPDIDERLDRKCGEYHVATPFERKVQRPGWTKWTEAEIPKYR